MREKNEILSKNELNSDITQLRIYAPLIAVKVKAGQFIILRSDSEGERIPLTVSQHDSESITIVFQKVGRSTKELDKLGVGDCLHDLVGPLGQETHVDGYKRVAVVGGGLGCAIALPVAQALKDSGAEVDIIAGFRNKELIILEGEQKSACTNLHICTDDGSYGYNGFTTGKLQELIEGGAGYDHVFAIGPLPMMKFTCKVTEKYNIPTTVSMNPLMVDGTGMCGCCRITVGGVVKFACVDGPDFDGHLVDFDECMARNATYREYECEDCNLINQKPKGE